MINRLVVGLFQPHRLVMVALYGGAAVAAALMLPGDSERIAALERDGRTREALEILEQRFAGGDRRQRTLFKLQHLYELYGNLPKLKETLELLAKERPRDATVQSKLADFYRQTHDEAGYVGALEHQIELRFSEDACREAIGIYRRSGKYDREQAMIQTCRIKGYRRPDDIIRLATLLAASGDTREASGLLRSADDLKRLKADRERLQLFQLLIEANQPNEAHRRAVRWVRGTKNDLLTLELIESLNSANFHRTAIALARDVSVPGDAVSLSVAETMLERGQATAARSFLRGWIDKAAISDASIAVRVVEAALDAGDPETALKGASIFGLEQLPESSRTELSAALKKAGLRAGLDQVRVALRRAPEANIQTSLAAESPTDAVLVLAPETNASVDRPGTNEGSKTAEPQPVTTALSRSDQDADVAVPERDKRTKRQLRALKRYRALRSWKSALQKRSAPPAQGAVNAAPPLRAYRPNP